MDAQTDAQPDESARTALDDLVAGLDDAGLDADARLELLRRIEAGVAAELDGLDGL